MAMSPKAIRTGSAALADSGIASSRANTRPAARRVNRVARHGMALSSPCIGGLCARALTNVRIIL